MRIVMVVAIAFVFGAGPSSAALRSPQVPVSGTALQAFLAAQGQAIDVATEQLDLQRASFAPNQVLSLHAVGGSQPTLATFGLYNAGFAFPPLYQIWPGSAVAGWFVVASFRTAPARIVVNLFDSNRALQGTTTYLAGPPDPTNMGFYLEGPTDWATSEDVRNAAGQARMLAFAATGANTGRTWLAWETTPGPGGDYADVIYLLGVTLTPVEVLPTTWSQLKSRFR